MAGENGHKRLGEILLERTLVTPQELERALARQAASGGEAKIGQILVNQGILAERVLKDLLAQLHNLPTVELSKFVVPNSLREVFPKKLSDRYHVVPIRFDERFYLELAMEDHCDVSLIEVIQFVSGLVIEPVRAGRKEIERCLHRSDGSEAQEDEVTVEIACSPDEVTQKLELPPDWWLDVMLG